MLLKIERIEVRAIIPGDTGTWAANSYNVKYKAGRRVATVNPRFNQLKKLKEKDGHGKKVRHKTIKTFAKEVDEVRK